MFVILVPWARVRVRERGVACHPNDTELLSSHRVHGIRRTEIIVVRRHRHAMQCSVGNRLGRGQQARPLSRRPRRRKSKRTQRQEYEKRRRACQHAQAPRYRNQTRALAGPGIACARSAHSCTSPKSGWRGVAREPGGQPDEARNSARSEGESSQPVPVKGIGTLRPHSPPDAPPSKTRA